MIFIVKNSQKKSERKEYKSKENNKKRRLHVFPVRNPKRSYKTQKPSKPNKLIRTCSIKIGLFNRPVVDNRNCGHFSNKNDLFVFE